MKGRRVAIFALFFLCLQLVLVQMQTLKDQEWADERQKRGLLDFKGWSLKSIPDPVQRESLPEKLFVRVVFGWPTGSSAPVDRIKRDMESIFLTILNSVKEGNYISRDDVEVVFKIASISSSIFSAASRMSLDKNALIVEFCLKRVVERGMSATLFGRIVKATVPVFEEIIKYPALSFGPNNVGDIRNMEPMWDECVQNNCGKYSLLSDNGNISYSVFDVKCFYLPSMYRPQYCKSQSGSGYQQGCRPCRIPEASAGSLSWSLEFPVCPLCIYSVYEIKWKEPYHAFLNCDGSSKIASTSPQKSVSKYSACEGTTFS
eukprot:Nk52_evm7s310 gene=Nk52_evmTU7s310